MGFDHENFSQYCPKMRRKLILWVMQTRLYGWALKRVIPFIRLTTYYTTLTGKQFHSAHDTIKMGDFIVCVDKRKLTSFLIPGTFSHAAFCIGVHPWHEHEIIEMTHDDCVKRHLFEAFKESDRVVILRARWKHHQILKAVKRAHEIFDSKIPYDAQFTLGIKALYCSELCLEVDVDRTLGFVLDDFVGLGRPYLSPDGVFNCPDLMVVWDSDNCSKK